MYIVEAATILLVICSVGALIMVPIKSEKIQIGALIACALVIAVGALLYFIPTPDFFAGDGYAITQDVGLIMLSFAALILVGMLFVFIIRRLNKKKMNDEAKRDDA
ncbi:MAG: hypothetical protein LUH54_00720 [Firmicutes bacterium]|nr:hypothetical protein [Bacillota bacterium]